MSKDKAGVCQIALSSDFEKLLEQSGKAVSFRRNWHTHEAVAPNGAFNEDLEFSVAYNAAARMV